MRITMTFHGGGIYTGRLLGLLTPEQFCVLNDDVTTAKKLLTGKTASLAEIAAMKDCCAGLRVALAHTKGMDSKIIVSGPISYLSAFSYDPSPTSKRELTNVDFVGEDGLFFSLETPKGVKT